MRPASREKIQSKVLAVSSFREVDEFMLLHITESLIEKKEKLGARLIPSTEKAVV